MLNLQAWYNTIFVSGIKYLQQADEPATIHAPKKTNATY